MADTIITLGNINELAQLASSIGDGDYIYIYKAGANGFAKVEKNVFFQGIAASTGGGMSEDVYDAIQTNVEALRSILYALTKTWLANLAFTDDRPSDTLLASIASQFTWPDNEGGSSGGDTPTGDPSLTVYVDGVAIANGGTINVGTKTSSSGSVSKTITIKGSNLTSAVSLSMGASTSGLSVSTTSIDASQVTASSGATATISYSGNIASASGSLTISSGTASVTLNLTASYQEQGGGEEPTPSEITFTKPKIKLNAAIASTSSGGNIVLDESSERTQHVCCTEFVELTGDWYKIVIHHDFASNNNEGAMQCRNLCKYKNVANNSVGYTSAGVANLANTNNYYGKDSANREITIYRESDRLDNSMSTGSYEVLAIAFGVRKSSGDSVPSSASYVKIYASADDTNPQVIFAGNDPSTYTPIS
jgi:hypothetical protein